METFLRNFAALGSCKLSAAAESYTADVNCSTDFGATSGIFANTAAQVQLLLSEVTPSVVPDSGRALPVIFRDWLTSTVSAYPNGCTCVIIHGSVDRF